LSEPSFQMSHLLKHESTVRQTPECFLVRLERAFEVAQDAVADKRLARAMLPRARVEVRSPDPRPPSLRHRCSSPNQRRCEIELAARDGEAGPCQRELRVKPDRLGMKTSHPLCRVEGGRIVDCNRA